VTTVQPGRSNAVVLAVLRSPARLLLQKRVCALRLLGRRTGRLLQLPVQYARVPDGVVVVAGRGAGKNWWRNLRDPRPVDVWLDGRWRHGRGRVLMPGDPDRAASLTAYRLVYRNVPPNTTDPVVRITLEPVEAAEAEPPLSGWRLWRAWLVWVTVGETAGFCVPAVVASLTLDGPTAVVVPTMLLAGAVEGALLGAAQAHVLCRVLPAVPRRRWVGATSAAAVVAWSLGLVPSTAGESLGDWPVPVLVIAVVVGGTVLLLSIGTAQWIVLREHVPRAGRWIAVTAAGWLAGLLAFMLVAPPLWHEGQATLTVAAIGAGAGLVMAGTVAAVTGLGLLRLLRATPAAGTPVARAGTLAAGTAAAGTATAGAATAGTATPVAAGREQQA
jgi:F420H(2)-dependent quinone reductase